MSSRVTEYPEYFPYVDYSEFSTILLIIDTTFPLHINVTVNIVLDDAVLCLHSNGHYSVPGLDVYSRGETMPIESFARRTMCDNLMILLPYAQVQDHAAPFSQQFFGICQLPD
jgi:hypothetical protein